MDNPVILIPFRIGCLIFGAVLVAYGGMSSIFEVFKLKHLDNIKEKFSQNDLKYLKETLVFHIFIFLLYTINGAVLLFSTIYYFYIPILLRSCALGMFILGAYPVAKQIKIFSFERSFGEIVDAFCTVEMWLHVYVAYVMWRYAVEVSDEEEELARQMENASKQRQQEDLKSKLEEFENRHSSKGSKKETKTQIGVVGKARTESKDEIKKFRGSKSSSRTSRNSLNSEKFNGKLNEVSPGTNKKLKENKSSSRIGRDALNSPQSIGKLEDSRPGKVNNARIVSREGDFQSMLQSFKNPASSLRSSLNAPNPIKNK